MLGVDDKLWKQWKKECCDQHVSKNWQSLPTDQLAKLCSEDEKNKKMRCLKDIKVDARCISDTIDDINHAVNVFPFQFHSLGLDLKNQTMAMNARMDQLEQSVLRLEHMLKCNMNGIQNTGPPPPKKIKLVSH